MSRSLQRSTSTITVMASLIAMMVSGCATPVGEQGRGLSAPGRGPTSPMSGYPQTSAHSPYGAPRPAAQPARPNISPVAPVNPRVAHANPPVAQINPAPAQADPSVAQVGFFRPAVPAACSCDGCDGAACAPAGQGCIVPTPTGCNVCGIDPQEFICDGGDHQPEVRLLRDDTLAGLDPEDTIVHYTTQAGDIEIKASNRVCVYAPRFSSVRKITGALAGDFAVGAAQVDRPQGAVRVDRNLPGLVVTDSIELGHADAARRIDAMPVGHDKSGQVAIDPDGALRSIDLSGTDCEISSQCPGDFADRGKSGRIDTDTIAGFDFNVAGLGRVVNDRVLRVEARESIITKKPDFRLMIPTVTNEFLRIDTAYVASRGRRHDAALPSRGTSGAVTTVTAAGRWYCGSEEPDLGYRGIGLCGCRIDLCYRWIGVRYTRIDRGDR